MCRVLWLLLCAAVVAFGVWAAGAHPWVEPPSQLAVLRFCALLRSTSIAALMPLLER